MPTSLIGAAGTFTADQRQIDISFYNPPAAGAALRRPVHICLGHGVGFMFSEVRVGLAWQEAPVVGHVQVFDAGASGGPAVNPPQALFPIAVFQNGVQLHPAGFPILFGRRLRVQRVNVGPQHGPWHFLYEPHLRVNSQAEMVPGGPGQPRPFTSLLYGGQIQNWRKIEYP